MSKARDDERETNRKTQDDVGVLWAKLRMTYGKPPASFSNGSSVFFVFIASNCDNIVI